MNCTIWRQLINRRTQFISGAIEWDYEIDRKNIVRLKAIIQQLKSWPTISLVGSVAAMDAWLLAQHADEEPEFQKHCLALMKALPKGEVKLSNLAYLEDRVRVNAGRPQLYGTQFLRVGDSFGPQPIEDPAHLDERRAAAGLGSFKEYEEQLNDMYKDTKT